MASKQHECSDDRRLDISSRRGTILISRAAIFDTSTGLLIAGSTNRSIPGVNDHAGYICSVGGDRDATGGEGGRAHVRLD